MIVAFGLDYVRLMVHNELGVKYIQECLPYADVVGRYYHGELCVDLSGDTLALVRMFDDLDEFVRQWATLFVMSRLDVYIDVGGGFDAAQQMPGTVIMNDGRIETIYSHKLTSRGNVPVFGRVYDALAAGHYPQQVTRYEIELKKHIAKSMVQNGQWTINPVQVALYYVRDLFGVDIKIDNLPAVEFRPHKAKLEHSRERFYKKYGKGILNDIEEHGLIWIRDFIISCLLDKDGKNG